MTCLYAIGLARNTSRYSRRIHRHVYTMYAVACHEMPLQNQDQHLCEGLYALCSRLSLPSIMMYIPKSSFFAELLRDLHPLCSKIARRDAGDHWKYDAEYEDRRMDKDLENFRTNPLQSNVHHVPPVNENGLCSKILSFMVIILSSKHMDDHRGTQWPIVAFVEIKREQCIPYIHLHPQMHKSLRKMPFGLIT